MRQSMERGKVVSRDPLQADTSFPAGRMADGGGGAKIAAVSVQTAVLQGTPQSLAWKISLLP